MDHYKGYSNKCYYHYPASLQLSSGPLFGVMLTVIPQACSLQAIIIVIIIIIIIIVIIIIIIISSSSIMIIIKVIMRESYIRTNIRVIVCVIITITIISR